MKFVALISRSQEKNTFCDRYPEHQFVFASLSAGDDIIINMSPLNFDSGIQTLQHSHMQAPFFGVLNAKEKFVRLRHQIETHLGLPTSVADPELFRDKWRQKQQLTQNDEAASTYLLRKKEDLQQVAADFFPSVLKPRFGFNSRSVVVVRSAAELKEAFLKNQQRFSLMKNEDTDCSDFVLEKYCGGTEHTVECFVQDGRLMCALISDKDAMSPPFFIETGDLMPTRLCSHDQQRIRVAAQDAVRRLQIYYGWAHIEIKLDGEQAVVIEVAARMGGGYFGDMIQKVYGISRIATLIEGYRSSPISIPDKPLVSVKGQRVVAWGITLLLPFCKPSMEVLNDDHIQLIWPRHPGEIHSLIIGPPYGYKNTIFEYFAIHEDPEQARQLSDMVYQRLSPTQFRLPTFVCDAVWKLLSFVTQHGERRQLDV